MKKILWLFILPFLSFSQEYSTFYTHNTISTIDYSALAHENVLKEKKKIELMIMPNDKEKETMMAMVIDPSKAYDYGKDMQRVERFSGLNEKEIIQKHQSGNYLVYFLGFSPGFPYMGGMDQVLKTPRLKTPRKCVPQGSVAIAGQQTGIYPFSSPGGWNLIGRTPLEIFNLSNPKNSLIQMGDKVQFKSISKNKYEQLKRSNGA